MEQAVLVGAALFCVLVIGLVTLATIAARRRERRRDERLREWAAANGWTVTQRPAVDWGRRLPGGNRGGIGVTLSGVVRGRRLSVAEYAVTETQTTSAPDGVGGTTTSTTTTTHHYTVVVALLTRPMPETAVTARPGLSRLARTLTRAGENATGHPGFDRAFRVRTTDPAAVRVWCTGTLVDAHLGGRVPPWSVHGVELLTYQPGRLDPATITRHTDPVVHLAALLDPPPLR